MKRTGEFLRNAREARGLSLNEMALSLKINNKTLTAIEEGDVTKLPAKTFLRGFVQSYAQALKIDTDKVMALFAEEMGSTRPQPTVVPEVTVTTTPVAPPRHATTPEPTAPVTFSPTTKVDASNHPKRRVTDKNDAPLKNLEEPHRMRTIVLTAVSIVLIILIFGTKKMVERYQRESQTSAVNVSAPLPTMTTPLADSLAAVTASTAAPEEKTVETSTHPVETAPTSSTAPTKIQALAALPTKTTITTAPPTTTPAPKPTVTSTTAAPTTTTTSTTTTTLPDTKAAATEKADKKAEDAKGKKLEIIIEALDSVDIEYSNSGGTSQTLHLNADQVHTIRSQGGLKLSVSNGGAVNLILNGKDLGVPGDLGKPIKLSY